MQVYKSYLLVLTHSMEQSPSWEANRLSASQEIPRLSWNPKGHYRITRARHLSLSPRHGASAGCGWRNGLQHGG